MINSLINDENIGFVILCPECNLGGLKYTSTSIKFEFPKCKFITMVGKDAPKDEILEMSKHSRIIRGGNTITSLIDKGVEEMKSEWCMIVTSGSMIRPNTIKKYNYFLRGQKDILFPVMDRKYLFDEATINGILINRNTYKDIGELGDDDPDIQRVKLAWASKALDKGCKFKGIVGAKLI
jgi:hypothetical protein